MGTATEAQHIQHAAKAHRCTWCSGVIKIGKPYWRWRWFDGFDASTAKLHPECNDAADLLSTVEPWWDQTYTGGEFQRGSTEPV